MNKMIDKNALIISIIERLKKEKQDLEKSLEAARRAAISAPGAMQSKSDTTKFQMNLLADNIRKSIAEKDYAIHVLDSLAKSQIEIISDTVQVGSLVEIEEKNGKRNYYFILSEGGGTSIMEADKSILVITPKTPIAIILLGKKKNDRVKFQTSTSVKEIKIINIL